jgi:hypothetical protein
MCSQETDIDYDKATPAELFERFEKALIELVGSKEIKRDCSPIPNGGYVSCLVITDGAREILDPIARPLRRSTEQMIDRFEEDGVIEVYCEFSGPHIH